MQVIFESRHPAGAEFRDMAVERVRFALRRLSWLVPRAKVQLSDSNGPRGGIDKLCQLEFRTPTGLVVISSRSADWRGALDLALQRAARVLVRSLQRMRKPSREARRTDALYDPQV
jgi:hypothetical protein